MNIDTDTQWAYMEGFRDYFLGKQDYLKTQVGNPDGEDKPNKKYYVRCLWSPYCVVVVLQTLAEMDANFAMATIASLYSLPQDPRVWVRKGEETMTTRVKEAFKDLLTEGNL